MNHDSYKRAMGFGLAATIPVAGWLDQKRYDNTVTHRVEVTASISGGGQYFPEYTREYNFPLTELAHAFITGVLNTPDFTGRVVVRCAPKSGIFPPEERELFFDAYDYAVKVGSGVGTLGVKDEELAELGTIARHLLYQADKWDRLGVAFQNWVHKRTGSVRELKALYRELFG